MYDNIDRHAETMLACRDSGYTGAVAILDTEPFKNNSLLFLLLMLMLSSSILMILVTVVVVTTFCCLAVPKRHFCRPTGCL